MPLEPRDSHEELGHHRAEESRAAEADLPRPRAILIILVDAEYRPDVADVQPPSQDLTDDHPVIVGASGKRGPSVAPFEERLPAGRLRFLIFIERANDCEHPR
jgi:hypothetical protein